MVSRGKFRNNYYFYTGTHHNISDKTSVILRNPIDMVHSYQARIIYLAGKLCLRNVLDDILLSFYIALLTPILGNLRH